MENISKKNKIYTIQKDKIIVNDLSCFCIKHILECGQVFRFERLYDYEVYGIKFCYLLTSLDKIALIKEYENYAEILTKDIDYFVTYFDLDTEYKEIKNKLKNDKILNKAMEFGYGIRILKQDPLEMIISFIISANNNIKRIQKSLHKLSREFGSKILDLKAFENENLNNDYNAFYAFPSFSELRKISKDDFRNAGVGFRDGYLVDTIEKLKDIDLSSIKYFSTLEQIKCLTSLKGIGEKVADCILLFGYYNMEVFPVDTWVKKIYNSYYNKVGNDEENISKIRNILTNKFGDISGFAQQYLFYYKRELEKN